MDDGDPESALVSALREVAGPAVAGDTFEITREGVTIGVIHSGGSGSYLQLASP